MGTRLVKLLRSGWEPRGFKLLAVFLMASILVSLSLASFVTPTFARERLIWPNAGTVIAAAITGGVVGFGIALRKLRLRFLVMFNGMEDNYGLA